MRIRPVGLSLLLLIVGAAGALAETGDMGRGTRDAIRAYHVQNVALDRDNPRIQQPGQQPPEQRQGKEKELGLPESSGYGGQTQSQSGSSSDNNRKQGKLSPEERRALRRQIDEAGHDIYAPRR